MAAYSGKERTKEKVMLDVQQYLENPPMIALPGGTWCPFCNVELCRNMKHGNKQSLMLVIPKMAIQIQQINQRYDNLLLITEALENFKLKLYERMQKGFKNLKEYQNFMMNNAPCNYTLRDYEMRDE